MGFAKIYDSILRSSIWLQGPSTKIVWITMLVLADKNGHVKASVGGLAHQANVTRDECEDALNVLSSPDPDSQSRDDDGRRVTRHTEGGWQIVNHAKYREMRTDKQTAAAERARKYRERKKKLEEESDRDASRASRDVTPSNVTSVSASVSASDLEGVQGETGVSRNYERMVPCPEQPLPIEVIEDMAGKLGVTVAAVREGLREFKSYWTIGGGAGRTKTVGIWRKDAREDIRRKHEQGKLVEPKQGAVAQGGSVLTP